LEIGGIPISSGDIVAAGAWGNVTEGEAGPYASADGIVDYDVDGVLRRSGDGEEGDGQE